MTFTPSMVLIVVAGVIFLLACWPRTGTWPLIPLGLAVFMLAQLTAR